MTVIPRSTRYTLERGDSGPHVYALQAALRIPADGEFGAHTEQTVVDWQRGQGLAADGVFGPVSSGRLARILEANAEEAVKVPRGLLRGIVSGESGSLIAAVNWNGPGGVDCGYTQTRVYEDSYGNEEVERAAFHPERIDGLAMKLRGKRDEFRPHVSTNERAWRLAVLDHNWPAGAFHIAAVGLDGLEDSWREPADWVEAIGARFDDGCSVHTPLEWARFYSLGAPNHEHPGQMTRYVKRW